VTWTASLCALLVMAAALLAADVADVDRTHRPIAALLAVWMVDPLRPVDGSAVAVWWAVALPALSVAAAALVLQRSRIAAVAAAAVVFLAGPSLLTASMVAVVGQALTAALGAGRPLSLAGRCCLVLLAGDVAALGGPLGDVAAWPLRAERWWIAQWQGALVAAVLVAMHLHARRARA
jgi:hypothetical protein